MESSYKANATGQSSGVTVSVGIGTAGCPGTNTAVRVYAFQVSGILTASPLD